MPAPPEKALVDNPLPLGGVAGRLAGVAAWVGVALFVAGLVAALMCVVPRFRAARGSNASSCARSLPEPAPRSPPCW
jgi:hypothetical protein